MDFLRQDQTPPRQNHNERGGGKQLETVWGSPDQKPTLSRPSGCHQKMGVCPVNFLLTLTLTKPLPF